MPVFQKEVAATSGGLVVAQSRRAADAGCEILRAGGNAVDAAVATSLALGVCEPWMSGIGGGATAIVKPVGGDIVALDGGMLAPRALDPRAYTLTGVPSTGQFAWPGVVDDRNITGPMAAAVPGLVAALGLAHGRFGRLAWSEALAPAIALAEAGHEGDWHTTLRIASAARDFRKQPAAAAYYLADGLPPAPDPITGRFRLETQALARTYKRLAEAGARDFYDGELAALWVREAEAARTWIRADDLRDYAAAFQTPRRFRYRTADLAAMDGLFAGVSLEHALRVVEERWAGGMPDAHAYAAYAGGLSDAYAHRLRTLGHAADVGTTTHFCVVDADGMIVSWTQTLMSLFGSHVLLPHSGVLLNNGIMWFDPRPGTPNALRPGAKPLANMCPTLVETADGRTAALGACGGRRIMPAVLQLASFLIDAGDDLVRAFARPRLDVSAPEAATVDARLDEATQAAVGALLAATLAEDDVSPAPFAIPSAILVEAHGRRTGLSALCHPWSAAVAA